jgi:hypothetical protein
MVSSPKWRFARKFQSVPEGATKTPTGSFHRRSGGRPVFDSPWSRDNQLQRRNREIAKHIKAYILRHITAPCSSSLPRRSGKSFAISTNYPVWVGGAGESGIEDGKSGDTAGRSGACFTRTGAFGSSCFDNDAGRRIAAHHGGPARGSSRKPRQSSLAAVRSAFRADLPAIPPNIGLFADSKIARGLLHSRAAFGIALRVAGE